MNATLACLHAESLCALDCGCWCDTCDARRKATRESLIARRMLIAKRRDEFRADVEHYNLTHPNSVPLDPSIPEVDVMLSDIDRKLSVQ